MWNVEPIKIFYCHQVTFAYKSAGYNAHLSTQYDVKLTLNNFKCRLFLIYHNNPIDTRLRLSNVPGMSLLSIDIDTILYQLSHNNQFYVAIILYICFGLPA